MLTLDKQYIDHLERQHPGISETIRHYETAELPVCPHCQSNDTAVVSCGIVGRSIGVSAATTKMHLIPNPPKPGEYFCNGCNRFFDSVKGLQAPSPVRAMGPINNVGRN
jgi:hypothetical protein